MLARLARAHHHGAPAVAQTRVPHLCAGCAGHGGVEQRAQKARASVVERSWGAGSPRMGGAGVWWRDPGPRAAWQAQRGTQLGSAGATTLPGFSVTPRGCMPGPGR